MTGYAVQIIVFIIIAISSYTIYSANNFKGKEFLYIFFSLIVLGMLFWMVPNILLQNAVIGHDSYRNFIISWGVIGGIINISAWAMMLVFTIKLKSLVEKTETEAPSQSLYTAEKSNQCIYEIIKNGVAEQVVVKRGFNWLACFFGPIWAWSKGMVGLGFLLLLANIILNIFFKALEISNMDFSAHLVLILIITLGWVTYVGLNGNEWHRNSLKKKGYALVKENVEK